MAVALEMAQDAKMPIPLSVLIDQLVKNLHQEGENPAVIEL